MDEDAYAFEDTFDTISSTYWHRSNHTNENTWIHNSWSYFNVIQHDSEVELVLTDVPSGEKEYTGAEIQSNDKFGYGRYEIEMKPSGESGVASTFFLYTGEYYGDIWNEIDFEFIGNQPTHVRVSYYYNGSSYHEDIDLGYDASEVFVTYAIEWEPDAIRWYAGDTLIHEVVDPLVPVPDSPSKMFMSIWTGVESEFGPVEFEGSTSAHYRGVSFEPYDVTQDPEAEPFKLTLYNADTDTVIGEITEGAVIEVENIDTTKLSVLAAPSNEVTRWETNSITLDIDGPLVHNQIEDFRPYGLFGDRYSNLWGRLFTEGEYTLDLAAYSERQGQGDVLDEQSVSFTLVEAGTVSPEPEPEPEPIPDVLRVVLYDSETNTPVAMLEDGASVDASLFDEHKLSILVTVLDGDLSKSVDSIKFALDGPTAHTQIENAAPWAIFGDRGSLVHGREFGVGDYSLDVSLYPKNDAKGGVSYTESISFSITEPEPAPESDPTEEAPVDTSTLSIFLVDAEHDAIIGRLADGDVVDTAAIGTSNLSVLVRSTDPTVESILFDLDGAYSHDQVESAAPYALFGDRDPNYHGRDLPDGDYSLSVASYARDGASGRMLDSLALDFTIV
ncbi:family 16 glycosylhydrolase [Acuticoccus kandeliae]|uniref:family 16 glycosylhydrolase n=1 Tax=Acuticoccus kandeliae TaxID=2073160 RepID=UPI000D3EAEFD|nr:family 16 glycosylhydrolase [Acuticoccus kandeliae]